jgi:hypothetical protein
VIDFRYHLISLVAVFLALGLGILVGTSVLNDQLVNQLRNNVQSAHNKNTTYEGTINELDGRLEAATAFANEAAPWLTRGALNGRNVVVIDIEGTDGNMVGDIEDSIRSAGGAVASTVTLTAKFALSDQTSRDQLALSIDSPASAAHDLRADAGSLLARRVADAAAQASGNDRLQILAQQRLNGLVKSLVDTDFLAVRVDQGRPIVPSNTMVLFLAGSSGKRPFDPSDLTLSFVQGVADHATPVLAAESQVSDWGIVTLIRDTPQAAASVATVDQADTIEGRVAVVLGLERAFEGTVGHYGVGSGATEVIPNPSGSP